MKYSFGNQKRDIIDIEGTFYLKGQPLVVSCQPYLWNRPANIAGRRLPYSYFMNFSIFYNVKINRILSNIFQINRRE